VSAGHLEALLLVQERDTTLDQLRHRRAALPARAELEACDANLRAAVAGREEVAGRRDKLASEERRFDDEARSVTAHAKSVEEKYYSGTVTSPRELQAMQADLDMLKRQVSQLEDRELEIMEQREALDAEVAGFDARISTSEAEAAALREQIASAEAEIDAEIESEAAARAECAAPLAPALVADYEKRRAQNRGAGAARLTGSTCGACHLTVPSTEAERIRKLPDGEVGYCDNCSAILVP